MTLPIRIDLAGFARDETLGDHTALMTLCERADRMGYGGIWFNEFHFRGATNPYPHLLLLGAEVLARTEHLRFGTSILVLPLHHPLMLAEQIAQLDRQSGGRLDIGIGRGTDPESFRILGIPRDDAPARHEEALRIMMQVWTEGRASAEGPHWQFQDVEAGPPPLQRPHPPIFSAAVSPDNIDHAARLGLPLLFSLEPNESRQLAPWRDALARHRQPAEVMQRSQLARYIVIARGRDQALERLDTLLERLNISRAARARAQGLTSPAPRSRAEMLEGFAIAGTPEDCAAQIRALCDRIGAYSLRALFSANGLIPMPEAEAAMELFAAEVLPALA